MKRIAFFLLSVCMIILPAVSVSAAYQLTAYDLPENGVHFSFDGTFASDNEELTGTPRGEIEFIEGHDGTPEGAVYLDSADDHIELLKEDFYGSWTVSAWLRTDEVVPWAFLLISYDYSVLPVASGNVLGEPSVSHHGAASYTFPSSSLPLGEWGMFTMTHDEQTGVISCYIDGEYVEEVQVSMPLALTLIGNDSKEVRGWNQAPFMAIDDLWLFGKALSADEVAALYTDTAADDETETALDDAPVLSGEEDFIESPADQTAPASSFQMPDLVMFISLFFVIILVLALVLRRKIA